ncbi:MAG: hypothetical protein IKN54_02220 [Lachnospiraceae bacterium]|nr:hypothetical protein [Lachnospiraceae bacterium]
MIKVADFDGAKIAENLSEFSIMKQKVKLDAVVDLGVGEITYVISDSEGKKNEYKTLESAVMMYNKMIE